MTGVLAAGDGSENFAVHSTTGVVYVAGNDGVLRGFDPVSRELVSSWQVGTDLEAIAISKDGGFALITEAVPFSFQDGGWDWTTTETVSAVYKVDLETGTTTTLTYASSGSDYTLGDVAFTDGNTAVLSQNILPGWSGWAPIVVLDLASETFTPTGSYYAGASASSLTQSASADQVLLGMLNLSSAEYHLIDDSGNGVDYNGIYENNVYGYAAGIEAITGSGNDGRIAIVTGGGLHVYDGEFDYIADLAQIYPFLGSSPGITFSADGSTLYAIDASQDRIVALSVSDWSITESFVIGNLDYGVLAYGEELALSPDGSQFYVSTTQGVVVVSRPAEVFGTAGNDTINGAAADENIYAFGGNDTVRGFGGHDLIVGADGDDALHGGAGNDSLNGGAGNDMLYGDAGNDVLRGQGGDDLLRGGIGEDDLFGGTDNDTLYGDGGNDRLYGNAGGDFVTGGNGDDNIFGDGGNDQLFGDADDDFVDGGYGDDNIFGGGGNDRVYGGAGNDVVNGQAGDDFIVGGVGIDLIVGGLGADRFVFLDGDFGAGLSATDRIKDFSREQGDLIDLTQVDADIATAGDQAFTWIGNAAFSGTAGELRYNWSGSTTVITGDTDGDGMADFALWLTGQLPVTVGDLVL